MADGRERSIRANATTVRVAVEQAGIELRGQDTTFVPQDSSTPTPGTAGVATAAPQGAPAAEQTYRAEKGLRVAG
jgi:hypothetical protein